MPALSNILLLPPLRRLLSALRIFPALLPASLAALRQLRLSISGALGKYLPSSGSGNAEAKRTERPYGLPYAVAAKRTCLFVLLSELPVLLLLAFKARLASCCLLGRFGKRLLSLSFGVKLAGNRV